MNYKEEVIAEDTSNGCRMEKGERAKLVKEIKLSLVETKLETHYYVPGKKIVLTKLPKQNTQFHFICDEVIRWTLENNRHILLLNFASAKKKGGGFQTGHGVLAQEENLCMSTNLWASLNSKEASEYYKLNKSSPNDGLYNHTIIYTKGVKILRKGSMDENPFELLPEEKQLTVDIITCPAVNYKHYIEKCKGDPGISNRTMRSRIEKVFAVALENGHKDFVFGPWGCGVFGGKIEDLMYNIKMCPLTQYFENLYFISPSEDVVLNMEYNL